MPLNLPASRRDVADRIRADIRNELTTSTPTLRASWLSTLATGLGLRLYPAYQLVKTALDMAFPQTARDEFLAMFGDLKSTTQSDALFAKGTVEFFGTLGSLIPISTQMTNAAGSTLRTTTAVGTITNINITMTSLTAVGTTVTAVSSTPHNLTTGITPVTISGALPAGFNASGVVPTVISNTSFTYTILPGTTGAATTAGTMTTTRALVASEMLVAGASGNMSTGSVITITAPLAGVNSTAYAASPGFAGGADAESEDSYRQRVITAWQAPPGSFSPAQISKVATDIPGITRVFVQRAIPEAGQVRVLLVRDDDTPTIIPDAAEILQVQTAIEAILPAHMPTSSLTVAAISTTPINFTLASLSPDSASMRSAIEANITAAFRARTVAGGTITVQELTGIISNSFDSAGNKLLTFSMTSPSASTVLTDNAVPIRGTVTYA